MGMDLDRCQDGRKSIVERLWDIWVLSMKSSSDYSIRLP